MHEGLQQGWTFVYQSLSPYSMSLKLLTQRSCCTHHQDVIIKDLSHKSFLMPTLRDKHLSSSPWTQIFHTLKRLTCNIQFACRQQITFLPAISGLCCSLCLFKLFCCYTPATPPSLRRCFHWNSKRLAEIRSLFDRLAKVIIREKFNLIILSDNLSELRNCFRFFMTHEPIAIQLQTPACSWTSLGFCFTFYQFFESVKKWKANFQHDLT